MSDLKQGQVRCGLCGTTVAKTTIELPGGFREDCHVCRSLGPKSGPHGHYHEYIEAHACMGRDGVGIWGPIPDDYWPVERS